MRSLTAVSAHLAPFSFVERNGGSLHRCSSRESHREWNGYVVVISTCEINYVAFTMVDLFSTGVRNGCDDLLSRRVDGLELVR
jgi:hypothetical protein